MKNNLISRQDAIALMCKALHYNYEEGYAVTRMLALPSAEPERKKGKWVKTGQSFVYPNSFKGYSCSCCGFFIRKENPLFLFCPSCGAEMKGEDDAEVH